MEEISNLTKNQKIEQILQKIDDELSIHTENVELGEALERLFNNDDYKKVIEYGYFEKEGDRLARTLLAPSVLKRDQLQNMYDKMSAIRDFKVFIAVIGQNASFSKEEIERLEEFRTDVVGGKVDPDDVEGVDYE